MNDPELDADGYPTDKTLRSIARWKIATAGDCSTLIEFVGRAWHFKGWGWRKAPRRSRDYKGSLLRRTYRVSTGGWSGNEEIIRALRKNWMFWSIAWVQSRRGGHHIFRVP